MLWSAALILGTVAPAAPAAADPGTSTTASAPVAPADEPHKDIELAPGKGVQLTSKNGQFQLGIGLFSHVLYTVENDVGAEDTTQSFTIRRARVNVDGGVLGRSHIR